MNRITRGLPAARRWRSVLAAAALVTGAGFAAAISPAAAAAATGSPSICPDANVSAFGPNVCVFNDTMSQATIQADLNNISTQQVPNQFGTQRYAILFQPGTYGSTADPLVFTVGYYTSVAGLGLNPGGVVINGAIDSVNQCINGSCTALDNFWRSVSNLTINVTGGTGCFANREFWAVSQASPMRRVHVNGNVTLFDYCSNPGYSSGGFIADSQFTGGTVINGSQQQFMTRNSDLDGWTNSVWNQVFCGTNGAPPQDFVMGGNQFTTLASCPVTEEEPFLYTDSQGNYSVFVPAVRQNSAGPSWASGTAAGTSVPLSKFFVASPGMSGAAITAALAQGKDLILSPGVYDLNQPIVVPHPDTVVLGLGMATLVPQHGNAAMVVVRNTGVKVSGLIIDDVWAWRADHGNAVGWTVNTADTGVAVTGNNVTAYGLFTEHYQKNEVIWSGQGGTDIFFQNELPYDPPSQSAWMASPTQDGYPAFLVTPNVKSFQGYGMGSYVVFIQTSATLFNAEAFKAPKTPGVQFHDLLGVWIAGSGGDNSIINGVGGPVTSTNPGKVEPVDLVSYP